MNFVALLLFVIKMQSVFGDNDWIRMKKSDFCPALHKQLMCTNNLINHDDVVKTIERLGQDNTIKLNKKHVQTGKDASSCGNPLRRALCSSEASPVCLEDKTTNGDYSKEKKVCNELYQNCPLLAKQRSVGKYVDHCARYLKREFTDMTCERVVDFKKGGCPRPTREMPHAYIRTYKAQSVAMKPLSDLLTTVNKYVDNVWDEECFRIMRELPCMPIYCSETDKNTIEIKNKRKDCSKAMKCVSKSTKKLNSLTGYAAKNLVDQIRVGVEQSCETVIKHFENLAKVKSGVSKLKDSVFLMALSLYLLFKMI